MARKKGKQPLTLLIVPHSQRPPISLRIPPWALSATLVMVAALLAGMAFFATRHYLLQQQLETLRREQQIDRSREQEMRRTILSQQQEVKTLQQEFASLDQEVDQFQTKVTEQVDSFQTDLKRQIEKFEADLAEIDRLSNEIRALIGLEVTPTPTPRSSSLRIGGRGGLQNVAFSESGAGPLSYNLGGREMTISLGDAQTLQRLRALQALLPIKLRELQLLREQVAQRVEKVDPEKRTDPAELEKQLELLDAAPKLWPVWDEVTSGFGYREFKGRRGFHTGIDIGVWYRTEVRATKDGLVIAAGWESGYGWMVEIRHEMGYSTLYAHLSRYFVEVGDGVKAGDIIGLSGSSGNTTGPHLHYEIRLNGTPVDPMKYLGER
ncbi:MAG: peptidoglycan DD-metalloendopeptidase family protein [Anaerolineae bacterium]